MSKKSILIIVFIFILFFSVFFITHCNNMHSINAETASQKTTLFKLDNLHNGDAKFYADNYIVTSINGKLNIIDFDGNIVKTFDDINVNWLSVESSSQTIIYANFNNEVGILQLDSQLNIAYSNIIAKAQNLSIDPTITKIDNTYFITYTEIDGTVNNGSSGTPNGIYTVKLYSSDDLINFHYITDVISDNHNIEDLVSLNINGTYLLFFEREILDKQSSSLEVIYSDDMGEHWSNPQILCQADSDNELGNILFKNNKFIMYYSSDILNPKASYDGASIFVKYFDKDFNLISKSASIEPFEYTLLYDVLEYNNALYFVYSEKYSTESNLVLAELKN